MRHAQGNYRFRAPSCFAVNQVRPYSVGAPMGRLDVCYVTAKFVYSRLGGRRGTEGGSDLSLDVYLFWLLVDYNKPYTAGGPDQRAVTWDGLEF